MILQLWGVLSASAVTAAAAAGCALQATSQQVHRCAPAMAQAMTQGPDAVGDAVVAEADTACEGQHLVGADIAAAIRRDGVGDGASACRRGRRCDGARACRRGQRCGGYWANRRGGSRLTLPALLARVALRRRRPLWWSMTDWSMADATRPDGVCDVAVALGQLLQRDWPGAARSDGAGDVAVVLGQPLW